MSLTLPPDTVKHPPLRVPERGELTLDPAAWKALERDPSFWRLVERKVVKVGQDGQDSVKLIGNGYVGQARAGDRDLLLVEKAPGALAALLAHATSAAFRVEHAKGPKTELGPLAELLLQELAAAVRRYASAGRQWSYVRRRETGSLVGGRIDVTASVRLRARGLRHRIAFDRSVASPANDTNRMIAAALTETERIASALSLPVEALEESRAMSILFADCRDAEVLFGDRGYLAGLAERLAQRASALAADVLMLAAVVLAHESFEPHQLARGELPRSWFLNLASLYEAAVRRTLASVMGPGVDVRNGKILPPAIFSAVWDEFTANPDLVVNGEQVWIGDVKYKAWDGEVDAADLYQLLAHTNAHEAKVAFLVHADDRFRVRDLGQTRDGIRTVVFGADPRNLVAHLQAAVGLLRGDVLS